MKVPVEVPQPLELGGPEPLELLLLESGRDSMKVYANGEVTYSENGGGGVEFTIDLSRLARSIRLSFVEGTKQH